MGFLQSIVKPFETINICTIAQKEDFCLSGIGRCRMADEGRNCRTVRRNAGRMATLAKGFYDFHKKSLVLALFIEKGHTGPCSECSHYYSVRQYKTILVSYAWLK